MDLSLNPGDLNPPLFPAVLVLCMVPSPIRLWHCVRPKTEGNPLVNS